MSYSKYHWALGKSWMSFLRWLLSGRVTLIRVAIDSSASRNLWVSRSDAVLHWSLTVIIEEAEAAVANIEDKEEAREVVFIKAQEPETGNTAPTIVM
jgi:hypothetical protein